MGRILRIDLSSGAIEPEALDPELASRYYGGRGLGAVLLWRHFNNLKNQRAGADPFRDVDPLSPDNVIIISASPTTGTQLPTSGRFHMNYKSPLTEAYGSTNAGGKWSVAFKKNGYDALVISGRADHSVYLTLQRGRVSIDDASEYETLDAVELRRLLKEKYSGRAQVLTIGEGGRRGCRFAAVMSDTGKALGRGGGGAVWGSKNLLAIVAEADPSVTIAVARPDSFDPNNRHGVFYPVKLKLDLGKFTKREDMFGILAAMGSLGILGMVNNFGQLIHNNMQDTSHRPEDVARINGEALRYHASRAKPGEERITVRKSACFNCPIICKRETTLLDGKGRIIEEGEGPEFESTTLMGANLSIYDLPTITRANNLANRYGLDTISLGATLAAFFELFEYISGKQKASDQEKRLLSDTAAFREEHGDPGFGRPELLLPLIHLTGKAEGIGLYLAQGSYRFCERYGHPEFSMSVKKQELPAYDPRTSYSQALCYEMNNRGGGHLEGGYTAPHAYCAGYAEWPARRIEGTPLISKNAALKNTTLDIIGACAYGSFSLSLDEYAAMVEAVTGEECNAGTLKKLAWRVLTLERLFNLRCGLSWEDDWLPRRFYEETISSRDGEAVCDRRGFTEMHREFYRSLGWNDEGVPEAQTIRDLGLDRVADTDLPSPPANKPVRSGNGEKE